MLIGLFSPFYLSVLSFVRSFSFIWASFSLFFGLSLWQQTGSASAHTTVYNWGLLTQLKQGLRLTVATDTLLKPMLKTTPKTTSVVIIAPPDTSFFARLVPILPDPRYHKDYKTFVISTGAERTELYADELKNLRVGLVVNQTSRIGRRHLVDTLMARGINVTAIFAPEHGFRGDMDAGADVQNNTTTDHIPIYSLYGKSNKPTAEQLAKVDIVLFDVQDVGARFYTYLSTLYLVMQACAEQGKPLIVLDRPNPNGHFVDGPIIREQYKSFVGKIPVPIVHGCTLGEIAKMINGENWAGINCKLVVVPCQNYTHNSVYAPQVKPSPNLPNLKSIYLYPSLCLFEGTCVSVGRGTSTPFQCFGHPDNPTGSYAFMPMPNDANKQPLLMGRTCIGETLNSLSDTDIRKKYAHLDLNPLIDFYKRFPDKAHFFRHDGFFYNLVGNNTVKTMIEQGKTADEISATWQTEVADYKVKRKKYLLYDDFE